MEQVARRAAAELAVATDAAGVTTAVDRAVARLLPRHTTARVAVLPLEREPAVRRDGGRCRNSADIAALPQKTQERVGVLLLDREVAERSSLLPTLEIISGRPACARTDPHELQAG